MKKKILLDNRKFEKKPETEREIKGVQYRLSVVEIEIQDLAEGLSN